MSSPPVFVETDSLVLFDIAACPLPGVFTPGAAWRGIWNEWVAETEIPGHTGACYYRRGGPDVKWNAGCGVPTYRFFIDEPGVYRLSMRSFSRDASAGRLRANGAFVRFDGGQWHKVKSKVHGEWTTRPRRTPAGCPAGTISTTASTGWRFRAARPG